VGCWAGYGVELAESIGGDLANGNHQGTTVTVLQGRYAAHARVCAVRGRFAFCGVDGWHGNNQLVRWSRKWRVNAEHLRSLHAVRQYEYQQHGGHQPDERHGAVRFPWWSVQFLTGERTGTDEQHDLVHGIVAEYVASDEHGQQLYSDDPCRTRGDCGIDDWDVSHVGKSNR